MLRMDGSTDEGRAYGPRRDCAVPSRTVRQRTSARLSVWNGRREFKALRRGGDKLVMVAGGCFDVVVNPWVGAMSTFGGKADIRNARSHDCL